MKYKVVKIIGHPRSGTHWINRLIDLNFFDGTDYLRHYNGHLWGHQKRAREYFQQSGLGVIYTYRNLSDTIKSIYRMRQRFGLDEDDFHKFSTTPMNKMYNPHIKVDVVRNTLKNKDEINKVDRLLNRRETVSEYIKTHVQSWKVYIAKPNFMMLYYDDLVNDFEKTMLKISEFLESDKTTFKDEKRRVGWWDSQDKEWKKPGENV